MPISTHPLDARTRRLRTVANLALAIGLSLVTFAHPASAIGLNAIHFVSGMLVGLAITIHLISIRRSCRAAGNSL